MEEFVIHESGGNELSGMTRAQRHEWPTGVNSRFFKKINDPWLRPTEPKGFRS